jgi:hypothetical protein
MDWPLYGNGQQVRGLGVGGNADTTLTAPAGANAKAAWTQLTASLSIPGQGVMVCLFASTNTARTYLVDIGVGPANSEQVVIANLLTTLGTDGNYRYFYFPLSSPQSSRIVARYQSNSATSTMIVGLWVFSQGIIASSPYSRIETIGADTSDSGGTQVVPGASHTKGNYAVLGTTTRDIYELALATANSAGDYTVGTSQTHAYDIAIGPTGSERIIIPDLLAPMSTVTDAVSTRNWPTFPVHIPARTQISMRAQSSQASVENFDAVVFGCAI